MNRIAMAQDTLEAQALINNYWVWIAIFAILFVLLLVIHMHWRLRKTEICRSNEYIEALGLLKIKEKRESQQSLLQMDFKLSLEKNLNLILSMIKQVSTNLSSVESNIKNSLITLSDLVENSIFDIGSAFVFLKSRSVTIKDIIVRLEDYSEKCKGSFSHFQFVLKMDPQLDVQRCINSEIVLKLLWILQEGMKLGVDTNHSIICLNISQDSFCTQFNIYAKNSLLHSNNTRLESKIYKIKSWIHNMNAQGTVDINDKNEINIKIQVFESQLDKSLSFNGQF